MVFAAGSIFDPIYNFFGAILAFFYGIIPNLGVSIILLTVVVMLVLFPLTAKQAKAMMPCSGRSRRSRSSRRSTRTTAPSSTKR